MSLIITAQQFAYQQHAGQRRHNLKQQPKTEHLAEVATLVANAGRSDIEVAAAWLHDIIEDTDVTLNEIIKLFGKDVATLVDGLTDPPHFAALSLVERKALQLERLQPKPAGVKIIKLADQISNVISVRDDPPLDTDWDIAQSLNYIEGANKLAYCCLGICTKLDALFLDAYQTAHEKYNISK